MTISQDQLTQVYANFDGGINTKFAATQIEDNELVECLNMHLEAKGGLEKRKGYQPFVEDDVATEEPIVGLYQFHSPAGRIIVRIQDEKVEYLNVDAWTDITDTALVTNDPDTLWHFITFRQHIAFTNGVDPLLKWDGTGNVEALGNTLPNTDTIDSARVLCLHRRRLVLGDVTLEGVRNESKIFPSTAGALDTWEDAPVGEWDLDEGDGDSITALFDVGPFLVAFKQNSLWRIYNLGDVNTQQLVKVAKIGTQGPQSAVVVSQFVFFLDAVGQLWVYDSRGDNEDRVINLSEKKLGPLTLDAINKARLQFSHLRHDPVRNELRCFMSDASGAGVTDFALVFNITTGGFTRFEYFDSFNVSASYLDAMDEPRILVGTYDGMVHLLDEGTSDSGELIPWSFTPKQHDFGDMGAIKGARMIDLYTLVTQPQVVYLEHLTDFQLDGTRHTLQIAGAGDVLG